MPPNEVLISPFVFLSCAEDLHAALCELFVVCFNKLNFKSGFCFMKGSSEAKDL